jgi:hypothetical protein
MSFVSHLAQSMSRRRPTLCHARFREILRFGTNQRPNLVALDARAFQVAENLVLIVRAGFFSGWGTGSFFAKNWETV